MVEGKTVADKVRELGEVRSQPYSVLEHIGGAIIIRFEGVNKAESRDEDRAVARYKKTAFCQNFKVAVTLCQDLNAGRTTEKETNDDRGK